MTAVASVGSAVLQGEISGWTVLVVGFFGSLIALPGAVLVGFTFLAGSGRGMNGPNDCEFERGVECPA